VPGTVTANIVLQVVGSVVALVVGIVITVATNSGFEHIWEQVAMFVISVLFAKGIHDGNRLVRLVLTLVAVLSVPLIVFDLFTGEIGFTPNEIVSFAFWDAGVVLLWLRPSLPHFAKPAVSPVVE
jgi:hypothetical protein